MVILGAHMSVAGGFHKGAQRAADAGCDCLQVFTTPPRQWSVGPPAAGSRSPARRLTKNQRARPISDDDVRLFRESLAAGKLKHPIAHASYLLNLASPDTGLWKRSVDGLVLELQRADRLGLEYVVLHPGAHLDAGEAAGLRRVCRALDQVHRKCRDLQCRCLIETTAGQGTSLGWRFEQLGEIFSGVKNPDQLGVCFDTCHVFAAGYPLSTRAEYRRTMREFQRRVGIPRIRAFHLNDSKRELGSRVDRHEHIGHGKLGLDAFRWLLNDRRFRSVPMYLETPKGPVNERSWDIENLCTLRSVIGGRFGESA